MAIEQLIIVVTTVEYEAVEAMDDQCQGCAFKADATAFHRVICSHYADCMPSLIYKEKSKSVTITRKTHGGSNG